MNAFIIIGIVVLVLFLLSMAAGYLLFVSVLDQKYYKGDPPIDPHKLPIEKPTDHMYPTGNRLYYFLLPLIAAMKELPFEELEIESFDGLKLHGYLLRGNPKEVAILVHGYRSGKYNEFADKIGIYQKRGTTVLCLDNRGHDKSEGRYVGFSELDKYDVAKWVDKINELFDNPSIYLHGVSMGGATVIHNADMHLKNVKGIIDDCGFDSIDNLCKSIIYNSFHIPFFPIGTFAGFFSKHIAGIDFKASIGETCVANTDIPILFIHGSADNFVPSFMSKDLYAACKSPKELLLVEGAGHAAAYMVAPEQYASAMNRLLDGEIK